MRYELQRILRRIWKKEKTALSNLTVNNLVISSDLRKRIALARYSNHELSNEPELFPAMLINRWLPVHVAIFHNVCILND